MEYIVITLSAILATTFLVYKLTTGLFGFTLRIKPLILCAACAVLISIVLPRIVVGYAGLAGTFVFLLFFAIIFAYFVAYFEEDPPLETIQDSGTLLSNDENPICSLKLTETTYSKTINENSDLKQKSAELSSCSQESFSKQFTLAVANPKSDKFSDAVDSESSPELVETAVEQESYDNLALGDSTNFNEDIANLPTATKVSDNITAQSIIPKMEGINSKHAAISDEEVVSSNNEFSETALPILDLEQNLAIPIEVEPEETTILFHDDEIVATITDNILDDTQKNNDEDFGNNCKQDFEDIISEQDIGGVEDELSKSSLPASDSLDDLIEYAFNQKEQENFNQALYGFYEALKLYPNTKTAPLLIVEIANILKHRGAYDEAIHVFTEGRSLPELQSDAFLNQQFIDTIAYLRIIKNTLIQNRLGLLPFKNIPDLVINEIDKEFREWKNLS